MHAHEEDSILNKEDPGHKETMEQSEHQKQDAAEEDKHEFEESAQPENKEGERVWEQDEDEPEEEVDLFAQQKADSVAMIEKIIHLVNKIDETVARHKIQAECLKIGDENPMVFDQKVYHTAKTNRYDTGMSSEFLMKHLMQLDNCLSYGSGTIKNTRKALVCRIKHIMADADSLSKQWLKRVEILEKLKAEVPACVNPDAGGADEATATDEEQSGNGEMDKEHAGNSDCEANADDNDDSAPEMDVEESSDESSDEEMDEDLPESNGNHASSPSSSERHAETKQAESAHLPSWQPRTQMYDDGNSHVVVAAFVPGMDMDRFNILIDGTELLIKGKKQPTMQDIISYRRGRAPNFGNLNLKIALPTDVVHTEGATATYEDGVLRIKFAKKQHRPARRQAYRQPMHYRRPMHYQQPRRRNFFNHPLSFWR